MGVEYGEMVYLFPFRRSTNQITITANADMVNYHSDYYKRKTI